MSVRIPGQAPIDYIPRDFDSAQQLVTQAQVKDGMQIHVAGGYSRLEFAALQVLQAYLGGAQFDRERLPEAVKLGEWSVAVAETVLLKCAELNAEPQRSGQVFAP